MSGLDVNYKASPTGKLFHLAREYKVRCIRGPVGSGKSVACVIELILLALQQFPGKDGVRRSRAAIVRNTFPELRSTTIKTFQDWLSPDACKITFGSPITGRWRASLPDGTFVDAEFLFVSLDKPKDLRKLLSLEVSWAWANEARELPKEVIDGIDQRCGRYPPKKYGAPLVWTGIIMDTNPPDDMHWWAKWETNPPEGYKFFVQPPALLKIPPKRKGDPITYKVNPNAENLENHPKGERYYTEMVSGKDPAWIRVYLLNEFGLLMHGKAVYGDHFSETEHKSKHALCPIKNREIILGWDFGLTPSCVVMQVTPAGQVRLLDEITSESMGLRKFASEVVKPLLRRKYPTNKLISVGDPAGVARGQTDEKTCFEVLDEFGIESVPARSNDLTGRLEAVRFFLGRKADNGQPGFLIDPECKLVLKGMAGGYHFEVVQASGGFGRLKETPTKNIYSHIHDALQYAMMEIQDFQIGTR